MNVHDGIEQTMTAELLDGDGTLRPGVGLPAARGEVQNPRGIDPDGTGGSTDSLDARVPVGRQPQRPAAGVGG
jgi:hypothetical protein